MKRQSMQKIFALLNEGAPSFSSVRKRLSNNENLGQRYKQFMEEYIQLGHTVETPEQNRHSKYNHYLPHHAVCKEESLGTKLRVVFNASQPTAQRYTSNRSKTSK